jgi:hypothetical protein
MIKEIWLSKIAPDVRLGVASVQPLVELPALAKIADDVHDFVDSVSERNGISEVAAVSQTGTNSDQLLLQTIQALVTSYISGNKESRVQRATRRRKQTNENKS